MTDRINSITVILEKDIRIDEARNLILALSEFRGVIEVVPNISSVTDVVAQERARHEMINKLFAALKP